MRATCPQCGNAFEVASAASVPGYCSQCLKEYDLAVVPHAQPTPCCHAAMKWGQVPAVAGGRGKRE